MEWGLRQLKRQCMASLATIGATLKHPALRTGAILSYATFIFSSATYKNVLL